MMKDLDTLLRSFGHHRLENTFKRGQCYRNFLLLLPKRYQKAIAFVYVKNKILFLALTHPGFKMEFEMPSNQEIFLQLWRMLPKECAALEATKVKSFYSKHVDAQKRAKQNSSVHYNERAQGIFEPLVEDKEIKERFLRIKQIIKEHNRSDD